MTTATLLLFICMLVIIVLLIAKLVLKDKSNLSEAARSYSTQTTVNNEFNNSVKYCSNCGAEINVNAVVCVKCGCAVSPQVYYENDVPSVGLNILSFLLPIVGLILYLVFRDKTPIKANAIGRWALISVLVNVCLSLICLLLFSFA